MDHPAERDIDSVVISPRFWPRDILDIVIGLPIGVLQVAIVCGLPGLFVFVLSGSLLIAAFTAVIVHSTSLLFVVRRLIIASDGLHFDRKFGSPRFLPWTQIKDISSVSRVEIVLKGWLWPIFPAAREMTSSLTAIGHYRIKWDSDYCYYPPIHRKEFEQYVAARLRSRQT
jgi:hypothetical protein